MKFVNVVVNAEAREYVCWFLKLRHLSKHECWLIERENASIFMVLRHVWCVCIYVYHKIAQHLLFLIVLDLYFCGDQFMNYLDCFMAFDKQNKKASLNKRKWKGFCRIVALITCWKRLTWMGKWIANWIPLLFNRSWLVDQI